MDCAYKNKQSAQYFFYLNFLCSHILEGSLQAFISSEAQSRCPFGPCCDTSCIAWMLRRHLSLLSQTVMLVSAMWTLVLAPDSQVFEGLGCFWSIFFEHLQVKCHTNAKCFSQNGTYSWLLCSCASQTWCDLVQTSIASSQPYQESSSCRHRFLSSSVNKPGIYTQCICNIIYWSPNCNHLCYIMEADPLGEIVYGSVRSGFDTCMQKGNNYKFAAFF